MKQYLWLVGIFIVVVGATLYAIAGYDSNSTLWIVASLTTMLGGVVLLASYLAYHSGLQKVTRRK